MMIGMIADFMPAGNELLHDIRMPLGKVAGDKERDLHIVAIQRVQHGLGILHAGAAIHGKGNFVIVPAHADD